MAIKFGTDGTLYCNYVKYNNKQARNLVYNNCFGFTNYTDGWVNSNIGGLGTDFTYDLTSKVCTSRYAPSNNGIVMSTQAQSVGFSPIAGHIYYGSVFYSTGEGFTSSDARFEWFCQDSSDNSGNLVFGQKTQDTKGHFVRTSRRVTANSTLKSGTWYIRDFFVSPNTITNTTQYIIVDLTEVFGSGNEPTKAWCDANILEYTKITGSWKYNDYYSSPKFNYQNYTLSASMDKAFYSWSQLNSSFEPRDNMYLITSSKSDTTIEVKITGSYELRANYNYYTTIYATGQVNPLVASSNKRYFKDSQCFYIMYPWKSGNSVSVPDRYVARTKTINFELLHGDGGMSSWQKISSLRNIPSTSTYKTPSFYFGFISNCLENYCIRMFQPACLAVKYAYQIYDNKSNSEIWTNNGGNNGDFTESGLMNTNSFDRIFDCYSNPIIHIKDPTKAYIKFRTPLQKVERTITEITRDDANAWASLSNDSWSKCTNTSQLQPGLAYFNFTESTSNKTARFIVNITSISGDVIYTNNLGWGYENSESFKIFYSGNYALDSKNDWWNFADEDVIECNDIEIHPEIDYISFDKTGTIKCKKLVTNF